MPVDEKNIESGAEADYSGAVKKTSPEEIKLVRKLDIRIMSILWAMYFLVRDYISACSIMEKAYVFELKS